MMLFVVNRGVAVSVKIRLFVRAHPRELLSFCLFPTAVFYGQNAYGGGPAGSSERFSNRRRC